MKKNNLKYVVDVVSFVTLVVLIISGLVLWFALPQGGRYLGSDYLGIVRHDWVEIHDWSGALFIVSTGIHLLLNLKWIVCMTKKIFF